MTELLVSVVMPVRDGERFLRQALDSVLDQTLVDLELIVVDDGSTDGTPDLLAAAAARDDRVRVVRQEPLGLTPALNAGCALAQAPLIARMDADDVMIGHRLERQYMYLRDHPDVAVLGGGIVLVDEHGREIDREPGRAQPSMMERNDLTHATVTMRAELFRELGGYRLDQAEDYDLWLRFEERHRLSALEKPVLHHRLHPGQFSVTKLERQAIGFLAVRAAAAARRGGRSDPLLGVDHLDLDVLRGLGVSEAQLRRQVLADTAQWVATLWRVGRSDEAGALLAQAADAGVSRARMARRARTLLLKRALRHRRWAEGLEQARAWVRAEGA
jgi:glycosyltransferase involved in cell wall biosynthesis